MLRDGQAIQEVGGWEAGGGEPKPMEAEGVKVGWGTACTVAGAWGKAVPEEGGSSGRDAKAL